MEEREKEYSQYSGHDPERRPYREYQIASYASPNGRMSYTGMPYRSMSYNNTYRGRSYNGMSNGMSNGMPSEYHMNSRSNWYNQDPYAYGYSGHSISDRVVSLVEGMYDEAKTDYERNQLNKFIEMIRAAG